MADHLARNEDLQASDASDLMRRLVKEKLLKFDGTPLFPERRADSPSYPLSDDETAPYNRWLCTSRMR